ncbi:hypothetical protein MRY88_27875 (plasmid) [Bacillus cereus]|uniref:Uncharacterized protein n=1 Tax=Bacillus cereus (strain 03BB102) TaxID=572264 RepID=A0A125Y9Z8_BACC3|nr:hypothetical protein [Bacillus cereus]ACO25738.1 conserved hypothetical protein [Bacillus cereus 03BB102]AJG51188.1 hypothetical protein AS54_5491 [Bacillus cereus 03BB102]QPR80805.1 hypothetical protein I6G75_00175 [Bacillus cereus]
MKNKKDLLHSWKIDLQIIKEEKTKRKKKNKKRKKYKIGNKEEFFGNKRLYYKKNGAWRQIETRRK